jgi:uroporphyrinogen-III synthase
MAMTTGKKTARLRAAAGPLAGANVVVTRPAASAQSLKRRLRALGATAVSLPGTSVRASPDSAALRRLLGAAPTADVAIFVSPAAVKFAFALRPALRFTARTTVCSVGAATARSLERAGVKTVIWPQLRQDSEGLLALPELARLRGRRVALIGAPGGRDLLAQSLRERGARIERIDVYQRIASRLDSRHTAALQRSSVPLLTLLSSAEILANLKAQLPQQAFAHLTRGDAIVSSQRIAGLAAAAGFARVHVAASAQSADMLDAAIRALAQHRL